MRARDSLIVATVLLVGGFAAADALRGDGSSGSAESTGTAPSGTARSPATERTETVEGGVGLLDGRLVYTDEMCVVQELDFESLTHVRRGTLRSSCALVSPADTERIAVGAPSRRRAVVPYRVST